MGLKKRGLFVTFEGIEGSGKTTQLKKLFDALKKRKYSVLATQEPGGTSLGTKVRHLLVSDGKKKISAETELFLFLADRAHHVREVVIPAIRKKQIVLCDRFSDSTIAYQAFGRELSQKLLEGANKLATGGLKPDLTFFLDLPVREGLKRVGKRGKSNRLDKESNSFYRDVRKGYYFLARKNPRIVILSGLKDSHRLHKEILKRVEALLGNSR